MSNVVMEKVMTRFTVYAMLRLTEQNQKITIRLERKERKSQNVTWRPLMNDFIYLAHAC